MPGFDVFEDIIASGDDMDMKKRRGFTLSEALIVTLVIAILTAGVTLGVDNYVASAKAAKIISNLHTLKKAVWAWYVDNSEKVVKITGTLSINGQNKSVVAGMVMIDGNAQPIQQWQAGKDGLNLSKYIKSFGTSDIRFDNHKPAKYTYGNTTITREHSDLIEGCYGVCDKGTTIDVSGTEVTTTTDRNTWYVGYRFKSDEGAVREKIRGRIKSSGGLWFGTADAHSVTEGNDDSEEAVWLRVR